MGHIAKITKYFTSDSNKSLSGPSLNTLEVLTI